MPELADDNTTAIDRSWENGYEQAESEFVVTDAQWCDTHEGIHTYVGAPDESCVLMPLFLRRGKRAF
jgi:hypothetical protein